MKTVSYRDCKDSGIEWLGTIPDHWEIRRIKDFSQVVRGGSPRPAGNPAFYEGTIPFLKVGDLTSTEDVYLSTHTHTIKEAGLAHTRLVPENTLLLTNSGATLGIPKICTFSTTFNDGIAAFIELKKINQVFLYYFLKSQTQWYLNQASFGQGQPNLNIEIISHTYFFSPPSFEQKEIAHYLDTKTAQIDRKIDLLTQKATLYSNLKQSLINETVTRGLDETVPMSDRGIDGIGEVPEHWEERRLKDLCTYAKGYAFKSDDFIDSGTPIVKATDIKQYRILESTSFIDSSSIEYYKNVLLKDNDIVISTVGSQPNIVDSAVGQLARIDKKIAGSLLNQNTVALRINKKEIDNEFLYYTLISKSFRQHLDTIARGTANQSSIKIFETIGYSLFLPTSKEQKAIAHYLDTKTAQIDQITQAINTQIEKLKELRKTLINDVVTGKIKVIDNGH